MQVDLQQLLPLLVRRKLDRRVGNDPSHRCRVAPPEGKEALLGVRVAHKFQRRSERVGDVFAGSYESYVVIRIQATILLQKGERTYLI